MPVEPPQAPEPDDAEPLTMRMRRQFDAIEAESSPGWRVATMIAVGVAIAVGVLLVVWLGFRVLRAG